MLNYVDLYLSFTTHALIYIISKLWTQLEFPQPSGALKLSSLTILGHLYLKHILTKMLTKEESTKLITLFRKNSRVI